MGDIEDAADLQKGKEMISIITAGSAGKRIVYGIERLRKAMGEEGISTRLIQTDDPGAVCLAGYEKKIYVGLADSEFLQEMEKRDLLLYHTGWPGREGYYVADCAGNLAVVSGGCETGALYGCMALADKVREQKRMPEQTDFFDEPVCKLRGPAIGLQKTKVEPPRLTYEYPVTPERFPWFYDRELWSGFLDRMLQDRCNILYLWTGHPFSSFLRMEEYPEALEVTEEELALNEELFHWLTGECEKRGIWVVLKFYSIHIPLPFAQAHGLDLHQSTILPLVADYTRKAIAQFIAAYPRIGLMVCLGEALRGMENKTRWFTDTVLPGVKDGIALAGLKEHPPVILRGHDCDPVDAMTKGKKIYDNIYTMWKYNGEGLTTYQPRGKWQRIHQEFSALSDIHIINVHILADLEPFRFGAVGFIQKCMQAAMERLGANGLHLYPMFFWDWPYSPDRTQERLLQMERDYLWYEAWFRYAWNPFREEASEKIYWSGRIAQVYGVSLDCGGRILEGLGAMGECAPRILRRVGITEGNRQTMSLGMTMSQFTNVKKYRPNYELWYSVAPRGESLEEFVEREEKGELHVGETPLEMIAHAEHYARKAWRLLKEARPEVRSSVEEYGRYVTDAEAICKMTLSYCEKIQAAVFILQYKYRMDERLKGDTGLLERAGEHMARSLEYYRELTELTGETYLYANSMQTRQRKIPFPDGDRFGHWRSCLPQYEREYQNFMKNLEHMKNGVFPREEDAEMELPSYQEAAFRILEGQARTYKVQKGECAFLGEGYKIEKCAKELQGLTGIQISLEEAVSKGAKLRLEFQEASYLLIGYLRSSGLQWLQVPDLETNTHADDRGGLSPVITNAVKVEGCPMVNVHAFLYEAGTYDIYLGTGGFLVLGVLRASQALKERDAQMTGEALENLDWMYEDRGNV